MSLVALDTSGGSAPAKVGKRAWRKQVLRWGTWEHPQDPARLLEITPGLVARLADNFRAGVRDIVPIPSEHTDDWKKNQGRVMALEPTSDGLDAIFQVDPKTDDDIAHGRALGCSAMFDEDWFDPEQRKNVGPVMRHICLTNVPVLKRLKAFEPVLLSEGVEGDVVYLSERTVPMSLEEMLAELKDKHGIDVEALKAGASRADTADGVLKVIKDSLAGSGVTLSEDADLGKLVTALAEDKKQAEDKRSDLEKKVDGLSTQLSEMVKTDLARQAEEIITPAVKKGYITPEAKPGYVALGEQEGGLERLRTLVKPFEDLPPKVELSAEDGTTQGGEPPVVTTKLSETDAEAEVKRLIEQGKASGAIRPMPTAA